MRFFPRFKAIWIIPALLLAVLMTLGIAWGLGYSATESKLAALRAQGLPTTGSEINAFYVVPKGAVDTTRLWLAAIDAVKAAHLETRGAKLPLFGTGVTPIPAPGQPWADLDASRTLLRAMDVELRAIRQAAAAGGQARFPVDFSAGLGALLPYTQESRAVARLLLLDAHVAAHDGNCALALQDLRGIFALSDAFRGEPTILSQLFRIAIYAMGCAGVEQLLPHCQWNDADLKSLQKVILAARFNEEMRRALCGERAMCLTSLQVMTVWPLRLTNVREVLRYFDGAIDAFSSPWPENLRRQRKLGAHVRTLGTGTFSRMTKYSVLLFLPAEEQSAVAGARGEARLRCASAGIAAQRYRLKHGHWPKVLDDIEQTFRGDSADPTAQFTDPFDGKPLRYKVEPTRALIYSIGQDQKDDGGDCDPDAETTPRDLGFYLQK